LLAGSELDSHAGARLVGNDDCRRLDYPVRGDGRTLRDSSSGRRARGERALASLPDRRDLAASARAAVRPLSEEASMSVETRNDLRALREAGGIVRAALDTMSAEVRPGVAAAVLRSSGARSAPMLVYSIHEPPEVPNVEVPGARGRLTRGLVIAVEPMATS